MRVLTTYTLPRPFYGYNIPISIQSAYLRDYANRQGFRFSLPVTEIVTTNSYVMLRGIFSSEGDNLTDLAVVSGFVLPLSDPDKMTALFSEFIARQDVKFHLVLEAKVLSAKELLQWADELMTIRALIPHYSSSLPSI